MKKKGHVKKYRNKQKNKNKQTTKQQKRLNRQSKLLSFHHNTDIVLRNNGVPNRVKGDDGELKLESVEVVFVGHWLKVFI